MLEVSTGSRLHFGLLELAADQPLRFGGLGLMLEEPGWIVRFQKTEDSASATVSDQAEESSASEIAQRIEQVCQRVSELTGRNYAVRIDVLKALSMHSGLGAGTQLASAIAFGLLRVTSPSTEMKIDELLRFSGRGKRSGIGLYGFVNGGLILDEGHSPDLERTIRAQSVLVNPAWRVVLITPDEVGSVTGGYEASLMDRVGQTPNPNRERMHEWAKRLMDLAVSSTRFNEFTEVLQAYVDAAGQLFAAGQGGMYNGASVSTAVALAKEAGLRAVGQSSWGPTVFGFSESLRDAEEIAAKLADGRPNERWQIRICTPARQGANWRWVKE